MTEHSPQDERREEEKLKREPRDAAFWAQSDEYGYDFKTAGGRLRDLDAAMPVMEGRLSKLNPPPTRRIPIMVGGGGERVTLSIVAQHATISNWFGNPEEAARKCRVLDGWCAEVGRDPNEIERSVPIHPARLNDADAYLERGFTHLIVGFSNATDDLSPLKELVAWRDSRSGG